MARRHNKAIFYYKAFFYKVKSHLPKQMGFFYGHGFGMLLGCGGVALLCSKSLSGFEGFELQIKTNS
jgi:hypothetical protein